MKKIPITASMSYLGLDTILLPILRPIMLKARAAHDQRTKEKLLRRMELKVERHDLIEGLLKKVNPLANTVRGRRRKGVSDTGCPFRIWTSSPSVPTPVF